MKNLLSILLTIILITPSVMMSQNTTLKDWSGNSYDLDLTKSSVRNRGLEIQDGTFINFKDLHTIDSKNFEVYEKLVRKTRKTEYSHVKVNFTGDGNIYAHRLEQLRGRRAGADAARAAGGIMAILGVISGNRDLTAIGMTTNAAGRIARNINDDRTTDTQTAMLNDLDRKVNSSDRNKAPEESEQDLLEKTYGKENVESLEELIDGNHEKALAYANVASLSDDANHRVSSVWLKAMIEKDQGNVEAADNAMKQLVAMEPDIENTEQVKKEISALMKELHEIRRSEH